MKPNLLPLFSVALLLAAPLSAQSNQATAAGDSSLDILQTQPTRFPYALTQLGVLRGEAWLVLSVDAEGRLQDVLVTGYTRREFADEATDAVRRWQYKPAKVRGEVVPVVREVHFTFTRTGVVIDSITGLDMVARSIDRLNRNTLGYRARTMQELDRIPVPVNVVQPSYPETLAPGETVAVTVEFYIDETGQVRMPAALERNSSELAYRAVEAVRAWKFEPPVSKGRPVLVLTRQVFHFLPPKS
ncbi:MAG: energy transducer TonB [Opitutae bacterium]|nr:energy transducer TonB [Opitutae bacterium]